MLQSLDSDMQNLVYENYSKFIRATDTIRDMQSKVENAASQLQTLESTIERTVDESNRINTRLAGQREHIEELHGVRSLLARLQTVFDLPDRLHACLQQGAFEIAADEYEQSVQFLDCYSDGAIEDVKQQVEEIVAKIAASLRMELKKPDISCADASNRILLLERFRQPTDRLREEYIKVQAHRLHRILSDARSWASPSQPAEQRATVRDLATQIDQRFLMEFAGVASSYNKLFECALYSLLALSVPSTHDCEVI